jgi:hypothetical protein
MTPHEQEWEVGEEFAVWIKGGGEHSFIADTLNAKDAAFIAAAPDMARALLEDVAAWKDAADEHVPPAIHRKRDILRKAGVLP